jgi:Rap1a immunity proteins
LKNYSSLSLASLSVLVPVLLCCSNVSSQTTDDLAHSGNEFVRVCSVIDRDTKKQNPLEVAQTASCANYVEGFVHGVYEEISYAHAVTEKEPPKPFCLSDEVEVAQTVRVVLKYVHDHPDKGHMATSTLGSGLF